MTMRYAHRELVVNKAGLRAFQGPRQEKVTDL